MMPKTPPPLKHPDQPSLFKKPWFWLVTIAVGGIVVIAILSTVIYVQVAPSLKDLPEPPDDSALMLIREEIPDEENAFYYFIEAVNHSFIPGPQFLKYSDTIGEGIWDEELAREILQLNARVIEFVEQGAKLSLSLAPNSDTLGDDYAYDSGRRDDLDRVLHVYPRLLASEGREREGLSFCVSQAALGNRLMRSKGVVMDYLVGASIQNNALESLMELTAESDLDEDVYRELLAELNGLYDTGDALSESLKGEYAMSSRTMDSLIEEMFGIDPSKLSSTRRVAWFYQPNRTKEKIFERFLSLIENVDKPCSSVDVKDMDTVFSEESSGRFRMITPNFAGEILMAFLLPAFERIHVSKCGANAKVTAAQTLLAAKAFEKETGTLPESLDALVPGYFESVPLDDFDGQPIRYDAEREIVYSIGRDLIDDGGDVSRDDVWALGRK